MEVYGRRDVCGPEPNGSGEPTDLGPLADGELQGPRRLRSRRFVEREAVGRGVLGARTDFAGRCMSAGLADHSGIGTEDGLLAGDGEQTPGPWDALQLMFATILELDARSDDTVLYRR